MSEEKKNYFFNKVVKVFNWVTEDIPMRIRNYHNVCEANEGERDKANGLYFENQKLIYEKKDLEGKVDSLVGEVKKSVEENLKYQNLEEEKGKYMKLAEQRGRLVNHLKKGKKGLISLLEQMRDKTPETMIEFLEKDVDYKQPYMFVNSKGMILGSTKGFRKMLKISNKDLVGKNYLEVLGEGHTDIDDLRRVKRAFNTYEEKEFDIIIEGGNKKTRFHVIKEFPILFKDLSIKRAERKKTISPIAFIPVYVRNVKGIGKLRRGIFLKDLTKKELEDEAKQYSPKIHAQLIKYGNYGWRDAGKISSIVEEMGLAGSYLYLKNELSKIVEQEEEKKEVIGSLVDSVVRYKQNNSI